MQRVGFEGFPNSTIFRTLLGWYRGLPLCKIMPQPDPMNRGGHVQCCSSVPSSTREAPAPSVRYSIPIIRLFKMSWSFLFRDNFQFNLKYDQQIIVVPPWAIMDVGNRYNYFRPLTSFQLPFLGIETLPKSTTQVTFMFFLWAKSTLKACSIKIKSLFQVLL